MSEPRTHPTEVLKRWMDEPVTNATQVIRVAVQRVPAVSRARFLVVLRRGGNVAVTVGAFVLVLGIMNGRFLPTTVGFTCLAGGFAAFSTELIMDPVRSEFDERLIDWWRRQVQRWKGYRR